MAEKPSTHTKMIEPSSPLYLHPSDNPGATITTCVFNGENYDMWEKAVKNALRAKNKLGIIDGTVNKPKGEDGNELNAWEACNSMIISWMFNVIDKSLHSSVAYAQTAKDMWEDLKERYAVGNAPRVHQLRSEIVNLKQEGMTVAAYYAKIKGMWDELNQYIEIPECTCGAAQAIVKSREDEKAHQFLMGLDDTTFGTVRSSILALDPLPTLGKIYAMVTQEERHRSMARGADRAEITVFAAKTEKPGGQTNKSGSCTHCGKTGHDVADCFQLKGYPDWWPTRQMGRGRGRGRGRNSYAGRGATSGRVHYANAVAEADTQEQGQCVGHDVERSIIPGLNDDNFQKLMALLRNGSSNAEKLTGKNKIVEEWILDSGASMHMTGRRDLFDWLHKWETACVGLPDGTKTVANEMGYDRTSRNPIGVGKLRNGVYYYKPLQGEKVNAVKVEEKYELWHRRLGHPSDRVLASIHSLGNNVMKGIEDYVCDSCCRGKQASSIQKVPSGKPYPIANYVTYTKFSVGHRAFLAAINIEKEPRTYKEAVTDNRWREAMAKEIEALETNQTWKVVDLPPEKKAIGCKWIYKIKYNADGSIERYKARLVAQGFTQIEGIDYQETFSPVAKMTSVRCFLAVAVAKRWELHQMDVNNAFLHGDLEEEASRQWFAKLTTALKEYGFQQSLADYSLFTYRRGNIVVNLLVYVDDLILAGNDNKVCEAFKNFLDRKFGIKNLGQLKYILGIEVARGKDGLFLSQRKYALNIIKECGLLGARPVEFPMEENHKLALANGRLLNDPGMYRRLVGRLIYLTVTRPDLTYAVHVLSQFMQSPREEHLDAAYRVVRYLKKGPGQGIVLKADNDLQLYCYSDSDWASCPLTRRSISGCCVKLGTSPISWRCKKQGTISRSSAEAEYRSMAMAASELTWLKSLLASLGVLHDKPMKLYCDNKAALHIAANPVFHERTKHIEIDCHFVREKVQSGEIMTTYLPSKLQVADMFTKALGRQQFLFLSSKLGIRDLHAPT
ncbi:Retrovirus-related Pol polyprotein from transposon RE1 [Vitis vinifera]|uniref:Retrovirus-related Pol polyprotein from transposon RE1 n=1 Tax=Vitis vinifera TaxID=29760 RepID=A0A438H2B8_VITVI|nr:Retrovirus-related Pol polyprotein from transposon RE1 [Vitis vinifera]